MQFRYARHTNNMSRLITFYTDILGLSVLGSFQDHDDYDGVFLGLKEHDWHLEFTTSGDEVDHQADEDDLLVFYRSSEEELNAIRKIAVKNNVPFRTSKNPYWRRNGFEIVDPDGFGVICSLRDIPLKDSGHSELQKDGIDTFSKLLSYVRLLPYGRNENRKDLNLVIKEKKGTCSSKHAYLKKVADFNRIPNVKLILAIYKMTEANTPGIGSVLQRNELEYIPEAHCYLEVGGVSLDLTNANSDLLRIEKDIVKILEIEPSQVDEFKVEYHKDFIRKWIEEESLTSTFEEIWRVREECIEALSSGG